MLHQFTQTGIFNCGVSGAGLDKQSGEEMKSINWYKRKILEHSYENQLAHISSCLNAVEPLVDIYSKKKPEDKVVLSCGHSYLALRVILEDLGVDVPKDFRTHPDRGIGIDCSTGSLGMGFPIALGMALARPEITVYCICSDGEFCEGSCFEALRLMEDLPVKNVKLFVIMNGYSAYDKVDTDKLESRIVAFSRRVTFYRAVHPPYLEGVSGHYHKLDNPEYLALKEFYND
jgi:transketolase